MLYNVFENRAISTVWGRPSNRYRATAFGCDFNIGGPVGRLCLRKIRNIPIKKEVYVQKILCQRKPFNWIQFYLRKTSWALLFNLKPSPFRIEFYYIIFILHILRSFNYKGKYLWRVMFLLEIIYFWSSFEQFLKVFLLVYDAIS